MFVVERRSVRKSDEKLASVGVGSRVGHRNDPWLVSHSEAFVWKSISEDRIASSSIGLCEISSLHHEPGNDSVDVGAFVGEMGVSIIKSIVSAKSIEVLGSVWGVGPEESENHGLVGVFAELEDEGDEIGDLGRVRIFLSE